MNVTTDSQIGVVNEELNLNNHEILQDTDESFFQQVESDNVMKTLSEIEKVFEKEEMDIFVDSESESDDDAFDKVIMNSQISKGYTLNLSEKTNPTNLLDNDELNSSKINDFKVLLATNKTSEKFSLKPEEIELLTNHPYTNIIPVIGTNENTELTEDIMAYGFLDSIIITRDVQVVDGRARVEIAKKSEILHKPQFEFYNGKEEELLDFILSKNIIRRHLSQGQKAAAALNLLELIKQENKKKLSLKMKNIRNKYYETENLEKPEESKIDSRAQAAKYFDVSSSFLAKAKTVQENDPALLTKVLNGTQTLEDAYKQVKPSEYVPKETLDSKISDFDTNFRQINSVERIAIDFLTKLGISDTTAGQVILKKLEKEESRKRNWESQSDNTKFDLYLKDFTEFMNRYINDSDSMNKFEERINMTNLRSADAKTKELTVRLDELKSSLDEDEIVKLNLCIKAVDKNKSELVEDETLIGIIKQFVSQITEILNDEIVE
jgi:hypothetical protein